MTALLIVDVQRDFLPGGALGVPDGDAVLAPLERLARRGRLVVASRDWHPADHCSFAERGGDWPAHCVRETPGRGARRARGGAAPALVVDKGDRGRPRGVQRVRRHRARGGAARARRRAAAGRRPRDGLLRARVGAGRPRARASRSWSWWTPCARSTSRPATAQRALAEVRDAGGSVAASGRLPVHG